MFRLVLLLAGYVVASKGGGSSGQGNCRRVQTINRGLRDEFCDQPLFETLLPRTEDTELLDNVCYTFFPLPDDPSTFQVYLSRVYCDGSNEVVSFIATQIEQGVARAANAYCTLTDMIFGYAGCDTYLVYRCFNHGSCFCNPDAYIFGLSSNCHSIGLSCLRKVQEIVEQNCLPDMEFYVLPMKLPNRCVSQQACINPAANNLFYKNIGFSGPLYR